MNYIYCFIGFLLGFNSIIEADQSRQPKIQQIRDLSTVLNKELQRIQFRLRPPLEKIF